VRVAASALVLAAAFGVPADTFDSFIVAPRMANLIAAIGMICDLCEPARTGGKPSCGGRVGARSTDTSIGPLSGPKSGQIARVPAIAGRDRIDRLHKGLTVDTNDDQGRQEAYHWEKTGSIRS